MHDVWPKMSTKMINSVSDVLESGKLNQWNNPAVKEFEKKFAIITKKGAPGGCPTCIL